MRVLLLSSNPEDNAFFPAAAKIAGLELTKVDSPEAVCEEVSRDSAAVIVIDAQTKEQYSAFEKCVADKFGLFSATLNTNNLFYVSSAPLHECPYLMQGELFGHFVHRTYAEENQALISRIFTLVGQERAFVIEKYFGSQAKAQTISLTKSLQKKVIVESLKNHILKLGFKSRMAALIATAADELIMNAIFDAPVDQVGKHIHLMTPRNADFALEGKNVVQLKIVFDGSILGVSVSDNHGSLDKKKLMSQHMGKSYESNQYEAKSNTAGAGLGLSHVYRNCGGLVFVCEGGVLTEVMLFFKKTDSFKDFKDQFRFLSTFMYFS